MPRMPRIILAAAPAFPTPKVTFLHATYRRPRVSILTTFRSNVSLRHCEYSARTVCENDMPLRTDSSSTTASSDRVLIWELGTKKQRRGHKNDVPPSFPAAAAVDKAEGKRPASSQDTTKARSSVYSQQSTPKFINIRIGQRWVDVDAPGDQDTKEISTHIASVRVPLGVMLQRCFGRYKEMVVVNRL